MAGAAGSLRRVAALDVIEVNRGDPVDEDGSVREILTTHHVSAGHRVAEARIECDVVVNCLGAWSPVFSAKIGVTDVTEPVRRQICLVDVHEEDVAPGVRLADLGMIVDATDLYFHPEGSHVLAGYSTPDEAPGFDFGYDGQEFFEAHSFTGRGVMQSYAVGRAVAGLIDDGRCDAVDPAPLARDRFEDPSRWVREELHI